MCHGPLFNKIIIFTLPLIAANVIGTLFNSADMKVPPFFFFQTDGYYSGKFQAKQ